MTLLFSFFPIVIFFSALIMSIRGALGPDPIAEESDTTTVADKMIKLQAMYLIGTIIACATTVSYLATPHIAHPWGYMMLGAFMASFASLIKQVFHPDLLTAKKEIEDTADETKVPILTVTKPATEVITHKKVVQISDSVRRLYTKETTDQLEPLPVASSEEEIPV